MNVIDTYVMYTFLKRLIRPFEKWDAYNTGVIDKDGNILIKHKNQNDAQQASFTKLDLIILNLKKLIAKLPGNQYKLNTMAAAYMLLKEDYDLNNFQKYRQIVEDAPVMNTANVIPGDNTHKKIARNPLRRRRLKP